MNKLNMVISIEYFTFTFAQFHPDFPSVYNFET